MKKTTKCLAIIAIVIMSWWILSSPPIDLGISQHEFGPVPQLIEEVAVNIDILEEEARSDIGGVPGHDDIIFQDSGGVAYLSGMGGWIWRVDQKSQSVEKYVKAPLIPTGMQIDPLDQDRIYFCASRMGGESYPKSEKVGLYRLDLEHKTVEPIIQNLPIVGANPTETTFPIDDRPSLLISEMNESNSRPFCLCNDLAVSNDGQRIYMSEPVPLARAAMGSGAIIEAIGLAPIGKLWLYNLEDESISLVLDNYTFVDGLILDGPDSLEEAVIFTETTKFRISKTYLRGDMSGTTEILWENLPGMPDGMDRDENGNIWIGLIKKRSNVVSWLHRNPWMKPFFLRLPQSILPVSSETGVLALSPDGSTPLFYTMHSGSKVTDISVVSPNKGKLYFPVFNTNSTGLYNIRNPL